MRSRMNSKEDYDCEVKNSYRKHPKKYIGHRETRQVPSGMTSKPWTLRILAMKNFFNDKKMICKRHDCQQASSWNPWKTAWPTIDGGAWPMWNHRRPMTTWKRNLWYITNKTFVSHVTASKPNKWRTTWPTIDGEGPPPALANAKSRKDNDNMEATPVIHNK